VLQALLLAHTRRLVCRPTRSLFTGNIRLFLGLFVNVLLARPTCRKALGFTAEISVFLFSTPVLQSPTRPSYTGTPRHNIGLVLCRTGKIHLFSSPTPPLIFTGGHKVQNLVSVFHISRLWSDQNGSTLCHVNVSMICLNWLGMFAHSSSDFSIKVKNLAFKWVSKRRNILEPKTNLLRVFGGRMSPANLVRTWELAYRKIALFKLGRRQRAKYYCQQLIVRFRSNIVQRLITWHAMYYKRSR